MNRIAVCISGQVRNDDAAFMENMDALSGIDADVFFSVWKRRGTRDFSGCNSHGHLTRVLGRNFSFSIPEYWVRNLNKIFPECNQMFPALGEVTVKSIQKYFPNSVIDIEDENINFEFTHGGNSFRMLYKNWRCNSLMRRAEIDRGRRYDTVVRMRPDVALNFNKIAELGVEDNKLYSMKTGPIGRKHLGDMFWIGTSKTSEQMAAVFGRAVDAQTRGWRGIHPELYDHAMSYGLEIEPVNVWSKGVNEFANFDPKFNQAIQQNFVSFVQNRRMDVEAAGGEAFCALTEKVLSAAITDLYEQSSKKDHLDLISDVTTFAADHPEQADSAYLMTALFFLSASGCDIDLRFESLIFVVNMKLQINHKAAAIIYVAYFVELFEHQKNELLDFLYGLTQHSSVDKETSSKRLKAWSDKQDKVPAQATLDCILENNRFCNWLFSGDKTGHEVELITLIERRAAIGFTNEAHARSAITAREAIDWPA